MSEDVSYKKLFFLFTQIVLYKLHYGSKLYTEVVDRTKMRTLYALELLVEARKNYSRILLAHTHTVCQCGYLQNFE